MWLGPCLTVGLGFVVVVGGFSFEGYFVGSVRLGYLGVRRLGIPRLARWIKIVEVIMVVGMVDFMIVTIARAIIINFATDSITLTPTTTTSPLPSSTTTTTTSPPPSKSTN